MANFDATKGQISYSGSVNYLPVVLQELKERYLELINEMSKQDEDQDNDRYFRFGFREYKQRILIELVSSAVVEGMANFLIAKNTDAETFDILQQARLIKKWTTLP